MSTISLEADRLGPARWWPDKPERLLQPLLIAYVVLFGMLPVLFGRNADKNIPISAGDLLEGLVFTAVLFALGALVAWRRFRAREFLVWFTLAFVLRAGISLLLALVFQYDDERAIHADGLEQVYGLFSWFPGRGQYHLVNVLYTLLGPNLLLTRACNVLIGSLMPFLVYDLTLKGSGDRVAARTSFLLTAFLPPLVVFSATGLKEIGTAFLMVLTVWFLVVPRRSGWINVLGVVTSIALLFWWRGTLFAAMGACAIPLYLVGERFLHKRPSAHLSRASKVVLVAFGFLIVPVLVLKPAIIIDPSAGVTDLVALIPRSPTAAPAASGSAARPVTSVPLDPGLHQAAASRLSGEDYYVDRFANSQAAVMDFVDRSAPLSPRNLVVFFLRGLFSPTPLRFILDHGVEPLIEASTTLAWYVLIPLALVGMAAHWRGEGMLTAGLLAAGIILVTTVGVVFGTDPYRHRMIALGLVYPFAALGTRGRAVERFRYLVYLWSLGGLGFTVVWLGVRLHDARVF